MGISKEVNPGDIARAYSVLELGFDGSYKRPLDIIESIQDFESEKGLFDRVRESNFSGMITELKRKDGELVEDVIPFLIEVGVNMNGKDSIQLACFSKEEGIINVDMNDLAGFEVVVGEDNKLLLEFEYINSGNQKERERRERSGYWIWLMGYMESLWVTDFQVIKVWVSTLIYT